MIKAVLFDLDKDTLNPEEFRKIHDNVKIPEREGTIKI